MDKIKCEVIRDLMPLVADDVASAESKELVDGHMEECEVCRAYFAGMTAQIMRSAVPEDGPTGTFVKFTKRMEKKLRMKKVLIALTAAFVALCVVIVGACAVVDSMNTNIPMPIEKTQAWLWHETNGDVSVMVQMQEGQGWYGDVVMYREGDIVYLTPHEPQLKLWNKGTIGGMHNVGWFDLVWKDDQLYYYISVTHTAYDIESGWFEDVQQDYEIPISYVRWGYYNDYTTLYEEGDVIPTMTELKEQMKAEKENAKPSASPVPVVTATPVPTVAAAKAGD